MQKIYTPLFLALLLFTSSANAQAPKWQWINFVTGGVTPPAPVNNSIFGPLNNMVMDATGNLVVSGSFTGSFVEQAPGTPNLLFTNPNAAGSNALYILKYDTGGKLIMSTGANGNAALSLVSNYAVTTDGANNIYASGLYRDTVAFGSITMIPTKENAMNFYIAKYDSTGAIQWVRDAKGTGNGISYFVNNGGISTDSAGNVYASGYFQSASLVFGSTTLVNLSINQSSMFVVKYNAQGVLQWAKTANVTGSCASLRICPDAQGNSIIFGTFTGSMEMHNHTINSISNVTNDMFIAKLDTGGNAIWLKRVFTKGTGYLSGMSRDKNGHVYLAGFATGDTLALGTGQAPNPNVSNTVPFLFVAKCDTDINAEWIKTSTGDEGYIQTSVTTDVFGNCYVAANINGKSFDIETTHVTTSGNFFSIAAKYSPTGTLLWAKGMTNDNNFANLAIAATDDKRCYLAASENNTLPFMLDDVNVSYSNMNVMVIGRLGYNEVATGIETNTTTVKVFPNPSSTGTFFFTGAGNGSTLEIYNAVGSRVGVTTLTGDIAPIQINTAFKGMYFYRITTKNGEVQDGKLVVE